MDTFIGWIGTITLMLACVFGPALLTFLWTYDATIANIGLAFDRALFVALSVVCPLALLIGLWKDEKKE